jgi:transcriptional regulator with XRE-family HTH domain
MLLRMKAKGAPVLFRKQLGRAIRAARVGTYGPIQQRCADAIRVDQSQISRWERGESLPRLDQLVALANACGTTVDALLGGLSKPSSEQLLLGLDGDARALVVGLVGYLRRAG